MEAATITLEGVITPLDHIPSLSEMQAVVGGLIAPVVGPHGDTVYVNDEGLLLGMQRNFGAELLAMSRGPLVGDAVICGPLDEEGNHKALSPKAAEFITRLLED